jgi:hypothetical protein
MVGLHECLVVVDVLLKTIGVCFGAFLSHFFGFFSQFLFSHGLTIWVVKLPSCAPNECFL